jgi:hypothetical protein
MLIIIGTYQSDTALNTIILNAMANFKIELSLITTKSKGIIYIT